MDEEAKMLERDANAAFQYQQNKIVLKENAKEQL